LKQEPKNERNPYCFEPHYSFFSCEEPEEPSDKNNITQTQQQVKTTSDELEILKKSK
jgi:hypothetical protein|tara:strand:+ start:28155 stop:28325 length:171 start_codon:yes stop_codon:yes gene_type:complete